jgi:hypothetical protein
MGFFAAARRHPGEKEKRSRWRVEKRNWWRWRVKKKMR